MNSETHNPYLPPKAAIKTSKELNPSMIGLVVGFWFASPLLFLLFASLIAVLASGFPNKEAAPVLFILPIIILLTVIFGWWSGNFSLRVKFKGTLLLALIQGTSLLIAFMSLMTWGMWWSRGSPLDFSRNDVTPTLIAWCICIVWTSLLALTIRWRTRKLQLALQLLGE